MLLIDSLQAEYANKRFEWLAMKAGCRTPVGDLSDDFPTFSEFIVAEFDGASLADISPWLLIEVDEE